MSETRGDIISECLDDFKCPDDFIGMRNLVGETW
jgi:hypothetical protein